MISSWKKRLIDIAPEWFLQMALRWKKNQRRRALKEQEKTGAHIAVADLVSNLRKAGVCEGDSLLVHCSLSKIGFVEHGASGVVQALLQAVGIQGTLLMPSFPAQGRNKDYLLQNPVFDIRTTPSAMGAVSEYFRTYTGVLRSFHPTDPVCALGPLAAYYTEGHFGQLTPYTESSPFGRLAARGGKILMLGTTLNGACTSLHTLEDAVVFPYPVYDDQIFEVEMRDANGARFTMRTRVHNPVYSAKRNCDALKPGFIKAGILKDCLIGKAPSMLIDARGLLEVMIEQFWKRGVTMYTPNGTKVQA